MRKELFIISAALSILFGACQKRIDDAPLPTTQPTTTPASQVDLLKDSVFLYTKEVYLWNDVIPSYQQFNPRQYTGATDAQAASNVMNGIRRLQPLDRFSFVTTRESSAGLQTGADVDFGFFIKAASIDKANPIDSVFWFVTYVYDQSTAGAAGVQRGWYINKINNTTITNSQASINTLNEVFFGNTTSASFEFVKPDGSKVTSNLSKSSFIANSVLHKSVVNAGGKKVGYLVFNQFFGGPSRTELNTAFNYFQSEGINELVVDLRYNPGGSTETQDDLANLIAPVSANNQVMYKYIFNSNLQQGNFPLLKRKPGFQNVSFSADLNMERFKKTGNINLNRVFFIVSRSSASASELLINNLKPYMDVKLIGDTTFGKPVGFFPIDIFNYSIYPISFRTANSMGNSEYYNGFAPDKLSPDGVNKNWGDVTEPSLASALKFISTGSFRISSNSDIELDRQMRAQKQYEPLTKQLEENKFSGMFIEKQRR
jgi:C-terminal processing protease CtpA/Prc